QNGSSPDASQHRPFQTAALLLSWALAGGLASPAYAVPGNEGNSRDCSKGGKVTEHNYTAAMHQFIMHISDRNGNDIGKPGDLGNIGSGGSLTVVIPPN